MTYIVSIEEIFKAAQLLTFYIEADSKKEAIQKAKNFEVFPKEVGQILPLMEEKVEINIIKCEKI